MTGNFINKKLSLFDELEDLNENKQNSEINFRNSDRLLEEDLPEAKNNSTAHDTERSVKGGLNPSEAISEQMFEYNNSGLRTQSFGQLIVHSS